MLGFLSLHLAILQHPRPVPPVPLILLLPLLIQVAVIFFVEQRQPLLGNITHGLEIDVDIGSVSLKKKGQMNAHQGSTASFLTS